MNPLPAASHQLHLLSDLEVEMTRDFDAPRELIFSAYTDPELIPHWWGPRRYTTTVDEMDVRVGGKWRYVFVAPSGSAMPV